MIAIRCILPLSVVCHCASLVQTRLGAGTVNMLSSNFGAMGKLRLRWTALINVSLFAWPLVGR